jgi:hypothetical protein
LHDLVTVPVSALYKGSGRAGGRTGSWTPKQAQGSAARFSRWRSGAKVAGSGGCALSFEWRAPNATSWMLRVTGLLTGRHTSNQDFFIRNMAEVLETATTAQNTLTILLASVAAISLLVGGIGVMNIMLVSVTERTREIGIRMATGARTRDILQQFLTEATVVSALGGLIGVAAGLGTAALIASLGIPVAYTLAPVAIAFTCAVATGLVFGFAPAMKAAHLDPVVALASE